jgi:hypothetical protein
VDRVNCRGPAVRRWQPILAGVGLVEVELGAPVDTFAGASGEGKGRQYGTWGYPIRARKPTRPLFR